MTSQRKIGSGFGRDSTAADVIAGIDLTGKTAIVTGGYSGLGLETVRALASAGATVVVPARRPEHARDVLAAAGLTPATAGGGVSVAELDLADLASVKAFAAGFLAGPATETAPGPAAGTAPGAAAGTHLARRRAQAAAWTSSSTTPPSWQVRSKGWDPAGNHSSPRTTWAILP